MHNSNNVYQSIRLAKMFSVLSKNTTTILFIVSFFFLSSVCQADLYFPHIVFTSNEGWQTEICIINSQSNDTVSGEFIAYDTSGQEVAARKQVVLSPGSRTQYRIGNDFSNPNQITHIVFSTTSSQTVIGYEKLYIDGLYRGAIPASTQKSTGDIYIPHISSNTSWWTGIALMNTTSSDIKCTVTFNTGATKEISLKANGHEAFTVSSLFDGQSQPEIQSADINNATGIVAMALYGSTEQSGQNYLGGILLNNAPSTSLSYPHLAELGEWWNGVVAYNPSSTAITINVAPYTVDGTALPPQELSLNGKEKFVGTDTTLSFPTTAAWFQINAPIGLIGFQLFGTSNNNQLAGFSVSNATHKEGIFAEKTQDGWTGIALVNTENVQASATLNAYNNAGSLIASTQLSLNAHEKQTYMAENIFGQSIDTATYIMFAADRRLAGFQINGSNDNLMLDGLPVVSFSASTDIDHDEDGFFGTINDCDDTNAAIYPGAMEICSDGIDQDCDGNDTLCAADTDDDNDTFTENQGDCDDTNPSISPSGTEICGDNIDQDCTGIDLACPPITNGDFTNSIGMTFNFISAEAFSMGSPSDEVGRYSDELQHTVTLKSSFFIQTTEVTQGQWRKVMGSSPSYFSGCGDNCPVEQVSWVDVQSFITLLNKRGEGTYRLPTEAEWEFTARAGTTTAFSNGAITSGNNICDSDKNLEAIGWYCSNSSGKTQEAAQKSANNFGIYDMHGNVSEWVQDYYDYYDTVNTTNPKGPAQGFDKVTRGGNWNNFSRSCRSANRDYANPANRYYYTGFRLLKEL